MVDVADAWTPPNEFEEYRLVRRLGRGGMGEVFLAHDTLLDRSVAIKFVAGIARDSQARERLLVEARAAARLQHPNVVAVYRVGELDHHPYIVSEYIRGQSLDKLQTPVPWLRALQLGIGLARGLAAAHRHGVLHRDLKPANAILADDGDVKLLDFGLAKLTEAKPQEPTSPIPVVREELRAVAMPVVRGPDTIRLVPADPNIGRETTQPAAALSPVQQMAATMVGAAAKLTRVGTIVGTPDYMPPEVFRGEPATRRSDVYSLGVLLFEICAGKSPFHEIPFAQLPQHLQDHDAPRLRDLAPAVDPRFAEIVDRCLARAPARRFASANELRDALEQLTPAARPTAIPEGNPYRGLATFEAEHRALFFGRTGAIRGVVDRLRTDAFVLVAGDSGVGKSSLCRAGVLPMIEAGGFEDGRTWSVVSVVPGRRPVAALAVALADVLGQDPEQVAVALHMDPASIAQALRKRASGVVVFVDQIEELITLAAAEDAKTVAIALAELAAGLPGVRVLATVRGDYMTRIAALPDLGDDVSRALYLLRPLTPDAMREAIVGPAAAKGFTFETEVMIENVVRSSQRAEGGMPLLQFALAELWDARDEASRTITEQALVKIGGVEGALERHADGVIGALLPAQREAARKILTRLVTLDGTRAPRTEEELGALDANARAALDALVRGRLLVPRDAGNTLTYEVAHEALLSNWATLRGWLDEQLEHRAIRQRLEVAAKEWDRTGRPRDALWTARRIGEVELLDEADLSTHERAFVAASRGAVRRGRVLRIAAAAGVVVLVIGVYAGVRFGLARQTDAAVSDRVRQARMIYDAALVAQGALAKLRERAFERFDANGSDAEALWSEARGEARELDRQFGQASELLEQAIHVGGHSRADVNMLMADVLYQRALLAEQDHRIEARDELLGRLAVYDESNVHRARWTQPAQLSISVTPPLPDTTIEVRRLNRDVKLLGTTRGAARTDTLAPGSFLISIAASEHEPISLPILLRRAEVARVELQLDPRGRLPAGFIYVPAGEFLYGTADEAMRAQYYFTAPQHPRRTGAFAIARTETTYAEYIAFLDDLAPVDRERHRPKTGVPGSQGSLVLELVDNAWRLTIQPTTTKHELVPGQKLVYTSRDRLREHDWLRLPVSGIDENDARAYVEWLDRKGHVPGARLCTDVEWERVARGADGRRFPSGEEVPMSAANLEETYGTNPATRGPDAVGSHPESDSPFGVSDMVGNVWEWVESSTPGQHILRGGAYAYAPIAGASARREVVERGLRDITLGFRICAR